MDRAVGEADRAALCMEFDARLRLEFHGSRVTSDGGLLAFRELDEALGLMELAGAALTDTRTGQNSRHTLIAQLRHSVFGRLAGYEDVNDADRLAHDPALRWIVGGRAVTHNAASASQMGRFETEALTQAANLSALADLSGRWIDRVHARRPVKGIVLDMDSSVSPTFGEQEGTAFNGHFGCTCYHPLFVFNQFGDVERCALRPGNVHSAEGWRDVLEPVVARYRTTVLQLFGSYIGTDATTGLRWVNPFYSVIKVSRRVQTLESAKIKVNDLNGNPIEIAAAVIWRVRDAAKAVLQVENYAAFVQIQSETSVRKLASSHPYDDTEADLTEARRASEAPRVVSLLSGGEEVVRALVEELSTRLAPAGIEVTEARITPMRPRLPVRCCAANRLRRS